MNRRRTLLAAAFLVPFLLLLLLAALLHLAPFGVNTLVCADARNQYISYYAFYQDLFHGSGDWLYSCEKVLGGSTAGLFAYYLMSPFNLLLLLFPGERLPLAINCLIALKLCACGLTMALYLESRGRLRPTALLFTTAYAFCGYNLAYGWCSMWLDAVVLLPLIARGIDSLLAEDRPLLYLFSLGTAIVACFYTGYMLCLFAVLYGVYRLAAEQPVGKALLWKRIGRFVLASLGAGALSAVVLLPGVLALGGGVEVAPLGFVREYSYPAARYVMEHLLPGRSGAFYDAHVLPTLALLMLGGLLAAAGLLWCLYSPRCPHGGKVLAVLAAAALFLLWFFTAERHVQRYEMDLAANLLPGKLLFGVTRFWEIYNGSANVYVGQLVLLLALSSFFNRAIPARERKANLLLLAVLTVSLLCYLPNLVWHGFEQNNCFNYRYSFVVCFFLILLAERSFASREGIPALGILLPALLLVVFFYATWRLQPYFVEQPLYLPTLLWLLLSAALLLYRRRGAIALLTAVQLTALCFTAGMSFRNQAAYGEATDRFAPHDRQLRGQFTALAERDGDFYRVRKDRMEYNQNDPMLLHYRGILHFSSAEKTRVLAFLKAIGIHTSEEYWANAEDGASRAADALLAVRYFRGEGFADYEPLDNGFCRNPYALPLAFAAPLSALDVPALDASPCDNMNRLFAALAPEAGPVFSALATECSPERDGSLTLRCRPESGEPLYLYLWDQDTRSVTLPDGTELTRLYAPAALYLGSFAPGQSVSIRLRGENTLTPPEGALFYQESSTALAKAKAALTASPCTSWMERESRPGCQVEMRGEDRVLIFNLPTEDGWSVRVDGAPAEMREALGLFLAVELPEGMHRVELRFVPPGLIPGAVLSASALLLSLLWALLRRKGKESSPIKK